MMTGLPSRLRRGLALGTAACLLAALTGCASAPPLPATGSADADKFLHDRGMEFLQRKKWLNAREYFRRLVDTYPRSQYRAAAKIGIGDSYLGENRADSLVLAAGEFREFLNLSPLHEKADYAQYRLAQAEVRQMLGPQRDQTATRDALRELERFRTAYPNSPYKAEVDTLYRQARDRLSEHEFQVGFFHYRQRMYIGAIQRFRALVDDDPGYSRRDAAYFYLAETYTKGALHADAKVFYERLLKEYPASKHASDAKKRLAGKPPPPPPVKRSGGSPESR